MPLSQYILDIFDLAFDGHKSEDLLRKQIRFLSQHAKKHTGIGLFIYFTADKGGEQYKTDVGATSSVVVDGNTIERINGVEIRNQELNVLADATVYVINGIIESLEIWNKNGHDYPADELNNYELHQMWLDEESKRIIIR